MIICMTMCDRYCKSIWSNKQSKQKKLLDAMYGIMTEELVIIEVGIDEAIQTHGWLVLMSLCH